jgi:MFS family permease
VTAAIADAVSPRTLGQRLTPLQFGVALQGFLLWVPVEKLFMSEIGFTPRSVAVMAAAYAAVVPLLEVPSGILADRWSRNQLLVCATLALLASTLLGGLSHNVPTYIAAAMILGVYFAFNSGTVDSIVYDVVLEETGSGEQYESWIGRIRMVEASALAASALVGGGLAGLVNPRATYFATLPFAAAAVISFRRFDEPRLHRQAEPEPLRRHITLTFATMIRQPNVRQVMLLAALVGMLSQAIFEFGPLWLVALAAPAALFGPYWAALVSTLGVGGFLTSRLRLDRRATIGVLAVAAIASATALTQTRTLAVVIIAQTLLALLLAILGIHAGKLLHDAVPSTVRSGVSSGVGTLSWLLFLPFSLGFGSFARSHGVRPAGWFLAAAALVIGLLLVASTVRRPRPAEEAAETLACRQLVELVTDYLDGVLPATIKAQFEHHLDDCDLCTDYLHQIELMLNALHNADLQLAPRTPTIAPERFTPPITAAQNNRRGGEPRGT